MVTYLREVQGTFRNEITGVFLIFFEDLVCPIHSEAGMVLFEVGMNWDGADVEVFIQNSLGTDYSYSYWTPGSGMSFIWNGHWRG